MKPEATLSAPGRTRTVWSCNEWDPLEEVVVGVVEGAAVPRWGLEMEATMPARYKRFFVEHEGKPFPAELVRAAERDLENFVRLLEGEGITVRRPERADFARGYGTPDWRTPAGLYAAMPRDVLLVVGDDLIEAPMAWRSRYFEIHAYRPLLVDYFRAGARWTAAPKPRMRDELYDDRFEEDADDGGPTYLVRELEPTFDAADFSRCGRDIFCQLSHVTNRLGVEWLRRHLGDEYRVHVLPVTDRHPMHIDATFVPLAPGKLLVNPHRIGVLPEIFRGWEIIEAPEPELPADAALYMSSNWLSINLLSLDPERVVVEAGEKRLARLLRERGFEVLPCAFRGFNLFGGSFHCATADIRRRGEMGTYF